MRVFETRAFARWRHLTDGAICLAAREISLGRYEADLGRGLLKKRIAYPGRGKSGGARVLVAAGPAGCLIFVTGRDKRDPGSDFTDVQVRAARVLARTYRILTRDDVERAVRARILLEVSCDGKPEA